MPDSLYGLVRYAVKVVTLSTDKDLKILEKLQRALAACPLLPKPCTLVGLGRPMGKDRDIY